MEVDPSVVTLRRPPNPKDQRDVGPPISNRGKFVYPMVVHFWERIGLTWDEALARAKEMWTQAHGAGDVLVLADGEHDERLGADDDAVGEILDGGK